MRTLDFDYSESVALTLDEGNVLRLWTAQERKANPEALLRVFADSEGRKKVLVSRGLFTECHNLSDAPYCKYTRLWYGDFPYGSWCYAIRICKVTGEVNVQVITTDINPRGKSNSERWQEDCLTYVPASIPAN